MNTQTADSGAAESAALARLHENQRQMAALMREREEIGRQHPGMVSQEALTREEKAALADTDFRFDKLTVDLLAPAMSRTRFKGDTIHAYLTPDEAQVVYAYRFVHACGFGALLLEIHEKRRVKISPTLNGR